MEAPDANLHTLRCGAARSSPENGPRSGGRSLQGRTVPEGRRPSIRKLRTSGAAVLTVEVRQGTSGSRRGSDCQRVRRLSCSVSSVKNTSTDPSISGLAARLFLCQVVAPELPD